MQIIKQTTGGKIAIGIIGTLEEREYLHNRIFNMGGTNGKLKELREDETTASGDTLPGFSYFHGEKAQVFRALVEGIRQKIHLAGGAKKWKGNPRGFCFACMMAAGRELQSWTEENFLGNMGGGKNFHKILDGGAAAWVPEFED